MPAAHGTFIAGTGDGTVTEARNSQKRQSAAVNVSEDLLNRQIQDYGLVCPERVKNLVWSYFKKYGSKNLTRGHDNLKLQQQVLCTICLGDQDRRRLCTVQLDKDNSLSVILMHQQDTLTVITSLLTLTRPICLDAKKHLKCCRHQPWRLTKTWSMSPSLTRRSVPERLFPIPIVKHATL
jgi:hypothetical protein